MLVGGGSIPGGSSYAPGAATSIAGMARLVLGYAPSGQPSGLRRSYRSVTVSIVALAAGKVTTYLPPLPRATDVSRGPARRPVAVDEPNV